MEGVWGKERSHKEDAQASRSHIHWVPKDSGACNRNLGRYRGRLVFLMDSEGRGSVSVRPVAGRWCKWTSMKE